MFQLPDAYIAYVLRCRIDKFSQEHERNERERERETGVRGGRRR